MSKSEPRKLSEFDVKAFLKTLTAQAGIYQMFDAKGKVLYVGKAKNLKNRVSSYFRGSGLAPKTQALMNKTHHVEVTITPNEVEALLLEQALIKSQRPPYNILLRDDKSYPYIFLSSGDDFPRLGFHRGAKKRKGEYFGPYPSAGSVRDSLNFMQKIFRVRQCEDSVFRNRSRPCLQYQIKRCTGPCVNLISKQEYAADVRHTEMFLRGDNQTLIHELADQMEQAAAQLQYEKAANYRDQIATLRATQNQQVIEGDSGDMDFVALARAAETLCVQILYVRQGRILGSKSYYYHEKLPQTDSEFLDDFVAQFYVASKTREVPAALILSTEPEDKSVLEAALKQRIGRTCTIHSQVRGQRQKWLELAQTAARENLQSYTNSKENIQRRYEALQEALDLDDLPQRMECFDISHSSGESTVASCVVFDRNGPVTSDYRRFNIQGVAAGDDYAAMEQAVTRRYTRIQEGEGVLPDILLIDGGKGQLNKAKAVLAELGIDSIRLLGVAKGSTRKAGFETLFLDDSGNQKVIAGGSPALHLIQNIRDEAHRFAITGHKQRRDKKRKVSLLEDIPGVGAKRRRELLRHFGGVQQVKQASVSELAKVPTISKKMAEEIYNALHG